MLGNLHKDFCDLMRLIYNFMNKTVLSKFEAYSSHCKQNDKRKIAAT